jgi:hypothetical protein
MATTLPDYLHVGAIVKITEWYGQIVDIATTEQGKVMVLVTSPKAIFRNHRDEWLEFNPDLIKPGTPQDYARDIEYYAKRARLNLEKLENLAADWQRLHERLQASTQ